MIARDALCAWLQTTLDLKPQAINHDVAGIAEDYLPGVLVNYDRTEDDDTFGPLGAMETYNVFLLPAVTGTTDEDREVMTSKMEMDLQRGLSTPVTRDSPAWSYIEADLLQSIKDVGAAVWTFRLWVEIPAN